MADGDGIRWPKAILILINDDGDEYRYAGKLRKLSLEFGIPDPEGIQIHSFRTDVLNTSGRFVRLGVASLESNTFCAEVEVYRGPENCWIRPSMSRSFRILKNSPPTVVPYSPSDDGLPRTSIPCAESWPRNPRIPAPGGNS